MLGEIALKIIIQTTTGGPDVLQLAERPKPTPNAGEVLVQVGAAGVNPVDAVVRAGYFPLLGQPPFTVGWDIAGKVVAVGQGVKRFAVGDRVFGMPRFPKEAAAYAEFVSAPADELAATPASWSDTEAGAVPLAGLTAWQALVTVANLKKGQRVLVHAGAGGVGHLAVQIAKALGAHVTATASAKKLDVTRRLGADVVIDYAREAPPENSFDVVLDPFAGTQAEISIRQAKVGGVVTCLLDASPAAADLASAKGVRLERIGVKPDGAGLHALASLADRGQLKPIVARSFGLSEAGDAQAFLDTRPVGKIVLLP
jgi:NADPH:quinone reductase-like Zn-dependent oxidoreductase